MQLREATKADLLFAADHTVSRGIFKNQPEKIEALYALEHQGEILAVGGIRMVNLSTAWVWVDLTDRIGDHMGAVYRVIKEWMAEMIHLFGIRRMQAYVELDFPEAIRMAEHLGFAKESVLEQFVGDKDAFMYVKIVRAE